uniref:Uncharacterized protein n=1 Tax=Rhizophora mucronata TaxID=61149 RepID=A0A2P2NHL8_RHIMU
MKSWEISKKVGKNHENAKLIEIWGTYVINQIK